MTAIEMVVAFDADGNPVTNLGRKIWPGQPWPHQLTEQRKEQP